MNSPRNGLTSPSSQRDNVATLLLTTKRSSIALLFLAALFLALLRTENGSKWLSTLSYQTVSNAPVEISSVEHMTSPTATNLDFAIIGFPKTGTTFLIYALAQHPEVIMPPDGTAPYEFCQIHSSNGHQKLLTWLRNASSATLSPKYPPRYGIKCPTMVRSTNAIENMMKVSNSTKLIVGVRHPVRWFQSFYNHRVYEKYNYPDMDKTLIPSPLTLNKNTEWRDVTVAYAKFEVYLKQLMKVPLSGKEAKEILDSDSLWEKRFSPNPYTIFLFTNEQLNDVNSTRQAQFRQELQEFLNLQTPLVDFNEMPTVGKHEKIYPEYIDMCDERYSSLKKELLTSGKKSSEWILNHFMSSKDVVVSNKKFFSSFLRSWGEDPCEKEKHGTNNSHPSLNLTNEEKRYLLR